MELIILFFFCPYLHKLWQINASYKDPALFMPCFTDAVYSEYGSTHTKALQNAILIVHGV
jgi:hypothetical protein